MAGATSLLPYKDTKNNRENQAFPRLFSHKNKHFPDYFLTKSTAHKRRNGSRDDFRFSILIFGEHSSYPGTCPSDYPFDNKPEAIQGYCIEDTNQLSLF